MLTGRAEHRVGHDPQTAPTDTQISPAAAIDSRQKVIVRPRGRLQLVETAAEQVSRIKARQIPADVCFGSAEESVCGPVEVDDARLGIYNHHARRDIVECRADALVFLRHPALLGDAPFILSALSQFAGDVTPFSDASEIFAIVGIDRIRCQHQAAIAEAGFEDPSLLESGGVGIAHDRIAEIIGKAAADQPLRIKVRVPAPHRLLHAGKKAAGRRVQVDHLVVLVGDSDRRSGIVQCRAHASVFARCVFDFLQLGGKP